jgi:hypothetical protein
MSQKSGAMPWKSGSILERTNFERFAEPNLGINVRGSKNA